MNIVTKFIRLIVNIKEGSSNDVLGAYPERIHVPAMPERRYLKTSRIMTLSAVVSICITIILGFILYLLPPQVSTIPRIAVLNKEDSKVQGIESYTKTVSAKNLLSEKYIADYIMHRNTIYPNTRVMEKAWGKDDKLAYLSTPTEYGRGNKIREREMTFVKRNNITRTPKILWIKQHGKSDTSWRARFETTDTFDDETKEPITRSWYADINIAYGFPSDSQEAQVENPLGFRITKYNVSKAVDKPEDVERFTFEE